MLAVAYEALKQFVALFGVSLDVHDPAEKYGYVEVAFVATQYGSPPFLTVVFVPASQHRFLGHEVDDDRAKPDIAVIVEIG